MVILTIIPHGMFLHNLEIGILVDLFIQYQIYIYPSILLVLFSYFTHILYSPLVLRNYSYILILLFIYYMAFLMSVDQPKPRNL